MVAEILSVGTELLLGDILNTNAQFIAKELAALGISVYYQSVVGDNALRLTNSLKIALDRSDLVITTGGLGPTGDDLTKETIAKLFDLELLLDKTCLSDMKKLFDKQNYDLTKNNEKQAYLPQGAIALKNNHGTAPGVYLKKDDKIVVMFPGPPSEMRPMFSDMLVPLLSENESKTYVSRVLKIAKIGESKLEDMIIDLIKNQTNPTIALYAKPDEVTIRITASAVDNKTAQAIIDPTVLEIKKRLGINVYGEEKDTLESVIYKLLKDNNLTISLAESATGGMITSRLINVHGISDVLLEGLVTYSVKSKVNRLEIDKNDIDKYGVVSEEIAKLMAINVRENLNADIGLSVTGEASRENDEGALTMYVGICIHDDCKVYAIKTVGSRDKVRSRTTTFALNMLRESVIEYLHKTILA